ncbi:mycofactocin-coupled SDR family oxidoreductase [Nocardia jinanensis]|uniref:3-ketoacyl-ACP reductase n=1 Tax=Nocardia jinanensis TaxID=382504 RepID=A0A917RLK6_9NOCA|nr:mycofactocin-coupled SDR family oxidoreductase [Nocardia jinanensis]GGL13765.1 3-ketoacyl-ACP reductase [Nocardia jinanensis]
MTGRVAGKVALITGAARGQGRAHAVRLAGEGADIIAIDLAGPLPGVLYDSATPADLDETARLVKEAGGRIVTTVADVRDIDALRAATDAGVAELGRLDIVIANAGICIPHAWDDISPQEFRDVIDINVVGVWNTVTVTAPHVIAGGRGGSIVLTSSYAGVKMQPFMVHYTASKHAVTGMARAFAAELGRHDIRVNSIHPGAVDTPMGSGAMQEGLATAGETNPALNNMGTPFLPRFAASAEEIADAVLFLASEESKFITAVPLSIDGGAARY